MNTATFGSIKRFLCAAPLAVLFALSMAAYADPPSRVGRVSFLQGKVSFFMDREEGWQKAQINFPVTSENSLWTEHGGPPKFASAHRRCVSMMGHCSILSG